jgi:eukaryotic-like serine/threonine-protein kinase
VADSSSPSSRSEKDLYQRSMALFDRAMACPPEARQALVDAAADDDPTAAEQVRAMLAEIDGIDGADRSGDGGSMPSSGAESWWLGRRGSESKRTPSLPGSRVGPYRILRRLKRGGMGEVYQAIREDHYEHPVALKVIKAALADPVMVARFQQERQILATLEHPGIARILDGGSLPDGRPFLVMEFVDGVTVTEYCDRQRLTIEERLALFERICEAVRHAHGQFVIHRDIKPANVLVTGDGTPKLLDFGIAKLLTAGGVSAVDLTAMPAAPSTPVYASPEQLRGAPTHATSDVYLLGVLLYELLTGARPFTEAERTARAERELLPVLPSQQFAAGGAGRLAESAGGRQAAAHARRSMPTRLARALAGDLDAITTTALRWDPRLRYQTVDALCDDLRRRRRHEPVLARPARPWYRAIRLVRRHRLGVTSAALVALSLLGGSIATFQQWQRAETLRRAAEQRDVVGAAFFEATLARVARALEQDPRNAATQRGFMTQAAEYLGRRQAEAGRNITVIRSVARGYGQVAHLQGDPSRANLGSPDDALKNFDHSVQLLEYVRASNGEDADALVGITANNVTMGDIYTVQGDLPRARQRYALARDAATRLVQVRGDEAARRQLALTQDRLTNGFEPPPVAPPVPEDAAPAAAPRPRAVARAVVDPPVDAPVPTPALPGPDPDAGWVALPGGPFAMGCDPRPRFPCRPDEQPRHQVTVGPFAAMAGEVSVALFVKHATRAGVRTPPQPRWSTSVDLPVVGVPYDDAVRVCAALGGRLPSEAEWEYAARGGLDGEYPWGDAWEPRRANYFFPLGDGHEFPVAVPAMPANAFGLANTVGNVWEWVSDWYDPGYYAQSPSANPSGPSTGTERGLRGGSYRTRREFLRVARRGHHGLDPTLEQTGFRCVR